MFDSLQGFQERLSAEERLNKLNQEFDDGLQEIQGGFKGLGLGSGTYTIDRKAVFTDVSQAM